MRCALAALLLACAVAAMAQDGPTWAFDPPRDDFRADALLDLRSLNEKVAGETGFVRVDKEGFVRGDGQPIRFWAVNSDVGRSAFVATPLGPQTAPDLARHARFLAKRGVNMVRLHRQISPAPEQALTDINEAERDSIWRSVAAMRKVGIYTTVSPYWSAAVKLGPDWGIAGGAGQPAFGLLFFDPTLQRAYKLWLKKLLLDKNPYTGLALAQDPSVAIIELQNEDSLLFWTLEGIKGAQRRALEQRYAGFLQHRHGSLAKALSAWSGSGDKQDDADHGRLALLALWEMTQPPRNAGRAARLADQTEFLARTMFDFNREIVDYLHKELGVRQLVNAGNWKTADSARLNDAERWSYTAGDVDAVNRYVGGIHQGANAGWAVTSGDRYTSDSVLLHPELLPINLRQTQGRPMLVTESAWVMPNAFGAEGPFLVAAYSSLSGVAGYYWFATSDEGWTLPQSANGYLPSQGKWLFADPDMLGNFPAAALAYRMGYVKRGTPVASERRSLAELWARTPARVVEQDGFDPNRDAAPAALSAGSAAASTPRLAPDAFLAGPVGVSFGDRPSPDALPSLAGLATPSTVRANTGELLWNREKGFCTVDTPMAQGVAAHFSNAPEHRLSDARFSSRNRFGAALAVSLDGAPLRTSKRVLVQYGTQSRPTGWSETPVQITVDGHKNPVPGWQITSHGHAPWQVARAQLDVALRNPGLTRATALDMNGMAAADVVLTHTADEVSFAFPEAAMYVVLQAGTAKPRLTRDGGKPATPRRP